MRLRWCRCEKWTRRRSSSCRPTPPFRPLWFVCSPPSPPPLALAHSQYRFAADHSAAERRSPSHGTWPSSEQGLRLSVSADFIVQRTASQSLHSPPHAQPPGRPRPGAGPGEGQPPFKRQRGGRAPFASSDARRRLISSADVSAVCVTCADDVGRGGGRGQPPQRKDDRGFGDNCWFCLKSPQVEKHLVVSVGTEVARTKSHTRARAHTHTHTHG
jgi:hypothetical protein